MVCENASRVRGVGRGALQGEQEANGGKHAKGQIVLLTQLFFPEMISTGMHMTELSKALTKLGWKIDVVCAQPGVHYDAENPKVDRKIEYNGITIHRVASIGKHRGNLISRLLFAVSFMLGTGWWAIRRGKDYDGLMVATNPPFLGVVGRIAKWLRGKPYVMIVYDVYPDTVVNLGLLRPWSPITWMWERVSRFIFRGAGANVVIGRDMAERLKKKLKHPEEGRLPLITNWSDEETVYPIKKGENRFRKEHVSEGWFVVQHSGTMARIHNLEPLIEAAERLKDEAILFQFVGDGAKKAKLQEMVEEKGLNNFQFLPFQPLEKLAEVLSTADLAVVCLAHQFTGFSVPSKTYGIMAAGVPILGFLDKQSEIGRTIEENDCGVVLPDADGKQVAKVIEELRATPERLQKMGKNGRKAFKEHHTLARVAEKYDQVLAEAFGRSEK